MFEDSVSTIPSIWASMNSWFTPAVLFVLLNVMIGTIAFTSTLANQKYNHNQNQNQQQQQHGQNDPQQPNLVRSPSVLQRLRSINFYSYRSQEPQHLTSHFKPVSDSDTHYNLQHAHQVQPQSEGFETDSQYIFAHPHLEKQPGFYENPQETQVNYFPEQIYQKRPEENQSQYFFEQTNEVKHQENETGFVFQQIHQETAQENGSHFDFEQALGEKGQENEYHYNSEQVVEQNLGDEDLQSLDEVYSKFADRHVSRSKSDNKPAAIEIPAKAKLPTKMKKSASMKSPFNDYEEKDILEARRPATVKERTARVAEADAEVDAKADDFINRFKEQLKLQRVESLIRGTRR